MTDIKELLNGAFADEPPMGINREAVIRKGRGKLLRRRAAITASLGITVVATLMGASLLSGGPPESATPDAEQCYSRGPGIPVTELPTFPLPDPPPPRPCEVETAKRLTKVLADAKVVPDGFTVEKREEPQGPVKREPRGPMEFAPGDYQAGATLRDAQGTSTFEISVSLLTTDLAIPGCAPQDGCEKRMVDGLEVHLYHYEIGWHAMSFRADRTAIHVYSSNKPAPGQPATRPAPALDGDATAAVAALKGLTI